MRSDNIHNFQCRQARRIAAALAAIVLGLVLGAAGVARPAVAQFAPQPGWQAKAVQPRAGSLLKASHIIYDPLRDWLYAAVPEGNGALSNSIVTYYRDGRLGPYVTLDSEPGALAISADSQTLYVGLDALGAVVGVDLDTLTPEVPWSLGSSPTCGRLIARDMVVLSIDARTVAVARDNPCETNANGPVHAGVAVYDDGLMRPVTTVAAMSNNLIEPANEPALLVGLDIDASGRPIRRLAVLNDGISEIASAQDLLSGHAHDIRTINGRLYATSGDVVNLANLTAAGRFDVTNNSLPVVREGRAYFLQHNPDSGLYELHIYDDETFGFLASTTIEGLDDEQPGNQVEFLDTGPDSMAIRLGDGDVAWLKVRLIQYTSFLPAIGRGASPMVARSGLDAD